MKDNKKPADIAREYRVKYGVTMPTLKLARIMYNENLESFINLEAARSSLRYIEGKHGESLKRKVNKPFMISEHRPKNPYNLPKSDSVEWLPYEIKEKSVLLMSDIHFPYHDVRALETAIDYAVGKNITAIMLNGDVLDMFKLSRYSKNPKARDFNGELEMLKDFITMLKEVFKVPIYYKMGNHEERYNDFLYAKAGELVGLDEFNLESVIKKRVGDGVELISDKRIVKIGKLNVVHGHEFTGGFVAPVNIARGLYLKAKVSTIQGHNHQTSEHTEPDLNGGLTTTWSLGCLCDLHPQYMPINKWNHGMAIVEVFEDSIFQVSNKRIQNGRVY